MVKFCSWMLIASASPSSRRAWVEIAVLRVLSLPEHVALLAEGVGRNCLIFLTVATGRDVALLAEGVGRNIQRLAALYGWSTSPSSRRAWVEIAKK